MKLTRNFTLEELTVTNYKSLQSAPTLEQLHNLQHLCSAVLQPLRDKIGQPIIITSGFRSERLNKHVGGVANSYHLRGLAADIRIKNDAHANILFNRLQEIAEVDLCLYERKGAAKWLHVQTCRTSQPRQLFNFNYNS